MSDLLVNIQGLAQDKQPGHSPPAAHPMGWEEVSVAFLGGAGLPTPLFLPSSEAPFLS